jgi:hypothetical protein
MEVLGEHGLVTASPKVSYGGGQLSSGNHHVVENATRGV